MCCFWPVLSQAFSKWGGAKGDTRVSDGKGWVNMHVLIAGSGGSGGSVLPVFLYCDIFNLEAVCLQGEQEKRFPLEQRPNHKVLCWSPGGGQWFETQVPVTFQQALMKRPAAAAAAAAAAASLSKKQKEEIQEATEEEENEEENEAEENEEENEAGENGEEGKEEEEQNEEEDEEEREEATKDDEGDEEEEEDEDGNNDEERQEAEQDFEEEREDEEEEDEEKEDEGEETPTKEAMQGKQKTQQEEDDHDTRRQGQDDERGEAKKRILRKRPAGAQEVKEEVKSCKVLGTIFCRALTGKNVRSYLLAKLGGSWKRQVVQVTLAESPIHHKLTKNLQQICDEKISQGVNFMELKKAMTLHKAKLLA